MTTGAVDGSGADGGATEPNEEIKTIMEKCVNVAGPKAVLQLLTISQDYTLLDVVFASRVLTLFAAGETADLPEEHRGFLHDSAQKMYDNLKTMEKSS